jgi:hypothetical protein
MATSEIVGHELVNSVAPYQNPNEVSSEPILFIFCDVQTTGYWPSEIPHRLADSNLKLPNCTCTNKTWSYKSEALLYQTRTM